MGDTLVLTCETFPDTILKGLKALHDDKQLLDFSLVSSDNQVFQLHSAVLMGCSGFFMALLKQKSLTEQCYFLPGTNGECIETMINFLYTGKLAVKHYHLQMLLALVEQLQIDTAVLLCRELMGYDGDQEPESSAEVPIKIEVESQTIFSGRHNGHDDISLSTDINPDTDILDASGSKRVRDSRVDKKKIRCSDAALWDVENGSNYSRKNKKSRGELKAIADEMPIPRRKRGRPKGSKNKAKRTVVSRPGNRIGRNPKKCRPVGKNLPCAYCKRKFDRHANVFLHRRSHFGCLYWTLCSQYSVKRTKELMQSRGQRLNCADRSRATSCHHCGKTFPSRSALTRHLTQAQDCAVHSGHTHACKLCRKTFGCWKTLQIHKFIKGHDPYGTLLDNPGWFSKRGFQCKICKRRFLFKRTLTLHKKTRCKNKERVKGELKVKVAVKHVTKWSCAEADCGAVCESEDDLTRHVTSQHPEVKHCCPHCAFQTRVHVILQSHLRKLHAGAVICELCGKKFSKSYHLKLHLYSKHKATDSTVKLYTCTFEGCGYTTVFRASLRKHHIRHQSERPFPCVLCAKNFKTEMSLEKHSRKIHLGIRPYVCEECGVAYGEVAELKAHVARHSDRRQFHCQHCQYNTHDKGNFRTHLYSRHAVKLDDNMKIYECGICSFTSDTKSRYSDHMRVHLNQRDIPCALCGKLFMTRKAMASHAKKVHQPKTLRCETCAYVTADVSKLREHMRVVHTHRNWKPYKCPYCTFQCATGGNCRKHVKSKHRGSAVEYLKLNGPEALVDEAAPGDAMTSARRRPRKENMCYHGVPEVGVEQHAPTFAAVAPPYLPPLGVDPQGQPSAPPLGHPANHVYPSQALDAHLPQLHLTAQAGNIAVATGFHFGISGPQQLMVDATASQWHAPRHMDSQ